MRPVSAITLDSVHSVAADGTPLLRGISLRIEQGELMALVGPSGSGKTSVIRAIAGLDRVTSGGVSFDDVDYTEMPVERRDVGIVFQSQTLLTRHTARQNVGFPLKVRKMPKSDIKIRVDAEARALGLERFLERWPNQLSAGHQQLVQIARALVRVPNVLLLDEPMAHLDLATRNRLRHDLRELQQGYGVTAVYATNDPAEARFMADRMAALEDGQLQQVGWTADLYSSPATTHIAWLTGAISFIDAVVERDTDGYWLVGDGVRIRAWAFELGHHHRQHVRVGVRPESIRLVPTSSLRATVEGVSFESGAPVTKIRLGGTSHLIPLLDAEPGTAIGVSIDQYLVFGESGRLIAAV